MKYYYEKPEKWLGAGKTYICNARMYNKCTLFYDNTRGLAIIQEHFDKIKKTRWWGTVEPWLASDIYFNERFRDFFEANAREADENDLYPTFPVRKVMWALRMKPLKKEYWEASDF